MLLRVCIHIIVPLVAAPNAALVRRRRSRRGGIEAVVAVIVLESRGVGQGLGLWVRRPAARTLAAGRITHAFIGRDGDATPAPLVFGTSILLAGVRAFLLVKVEIDALPTNKPAHQPTTSEVFRVDDDAAPAKLYTLSAPVYPSKIENEGSLDGTPYPRRRVNVELLFEPGNPVKAIKKAVGSQRYKVKRIYDGRDGGLAE